MASELRVNTINSRTGFGTITVSETGQDLVGITTIENLTAENTLVGAAASFTGNVQIGGVLTYEDVTNIDSVGLITARQGIEIGARPGVAASISVDGNAIFSGISTFGGALSAQTVTSINDLKATAGTINVKSGTSINTNSDTSAHGALHKNTNSGEFAIVSGGTGGNNHLAFYTSASAAPTEKLRITAAGVVHINNTFSAHSEGDDLVVGGSGWRGMTIYGQGGGGVIQFADDGDQRAGQIMYNHGDNSMLFRVSGNQTRLMIDSSGRLLHGHTSSIGNMGYGGSGLKAAALQVVTADSTFNNGLALINYRDGSGNPAIPPILRLGLSRNDTKGSNGIVLSGDTVGGIQFQGNDGSNFRSVARIDAQVDGTPGSDDMPGRIVFLTTADGAYSPTERLRITSTGELRFGSGTRSGNTNSICAANGHSIDLNGSEYLYFRTANSERMRIKTDGGILLGTTGTTYSEFYSIKNSAETSGLYINQNSSNDHSGIICRHGRGLSGYSGVMFNFKRNDGTTVGTIHIGVSATAYNTSSDYRLKENQVTIANASTKVKQLKPYEFNFKDDPDYKHLGFFAHEVQEVIPNGIVTGEKDAVYTESNAEGQAGDIKAQSLDYAKLTPLLTAALQEAIAEIETLKTEVAALKSS